jgi:CHAT domain-containing protein
LRELSRAYRASRFFDIAEQFQNRILELARETGNFRQQIDALYDLGMIQLDGNNPRQAESYLRQALTVVESARSQLTSNANRVAIADAFFMVYGGLQQSLVAQKNFVSALEVSEQSRARIFAESLVNRITLRKKIGAVPNNTALSFPQIQAIARQEQATIVQYSLFSDFSDSDPLSRRILNSWNFNGRSILFIWVVKPTGELHFRQVDLSHLDTIKSIDPSIVTALNMDGARSNSTQQQTTMFNLITQSRTGLGLNPQRGRIAIKPTQDAESNSLKSLYNLLIKPIAEWLPSSPEEQVILIPQGSLFQVPFAALPNPAGRTLIESHTLRLAPSIQILGLTRQLRRQTKLSINRIKRNPSTALIVGNPTMPKAMDRFGTSLTLSPLPGAEKEALSIGKLLNLSPLIRQQATETTIKKQISNAQLIHLATHGLLDYGPSVPEDIQSLPGAIALAPSQQDDGLLTTREILEMNLKANMVVLSACDTGQGTITGDGVIGLSRAFITAGVPSVIVSLWAVPDAPTAQLMTEFYAQLQRYSDKAQALRQAMLVTKKQYPNPKDWAAFILIGGL